MMNSTCILIVGSGGREHAIALKLAESSSVKTVYVAPGNGGTDGIGKLQNVPIKESDIEGLAQFAKEKNIHLTVVGPEGPLVAGIVDYFQSRHLSIVGPTAYCAQLEGSKAFAKSFMSRYHIPTASYQEYAHYDHALAYIAQQATYPIVIKADGLASGKGVVIAYSLEEAKDALKHCFIAKTFGQAGEKVVIESFLQGQEVSIIALCDGKTIRPLIPVQDHKALQDGDKGPNTGGMGTYGPTPFITPAIQEKIVMRILQPTIDGMRQEGHPFKGILFAGLMVDEQGDPYTLEFNVRFGDPETQVIMAMLDTSLLAIFESIGTQTLESVPIRWKPGFAVCVVLASQGYPLAPLLGQEITMRPFVQQGLQMIHAGTTKNNTGWVTSGGRVLSSVAHHEQMERTIQLAYEGVGSVWFDGMQYRTDIGKRVGGAKI